MSTNASPAPSTSGTLQQPSLKSVATQVRGRRAVDGAGVSLVRVLGNWTADEFDPFLMLDSFDSTGPADYTAGFPMHPHRGIETVSYVARGAMLHRDSLGHTDQVGDGEVQWMCAGSGILHEERIPAADRLLGCQLWLNLPAADKMCPPSYHAIKAADIKEFPLSGTTTHRDEASTGAGDSPTECSGDSRRVGTLRLLAGSFGEHRGHQGAHLPLDYYDIRLDAGASVTIPVKHGRTTMVFTLLGDATVGGTALREKTAALLTRRGDAVRIEAAGSPAQLLLMSAPRLDEPVAWGGPIAMNTEEELRQAFADLDSGTFLRDAIAYEE